MAHALVVDADLEIQRCLSEIVRSEGMTLSLADSVRKGRIEIGRHRPNIAFINQSLPDGEGLALISDLPGREQTATVLMAAKPSVETALSALRAGVFDFLPLPLELKRVHHALASIGTSADSPHPVGVSVIDFAAEPGWFGNLLGRSPAMKALYDQLARVAPTSATVLLIGESGTGKELAAQTVHRLSRRARQPFFPLNCGAVSAQLIESELFGHERGSFTGADRQHKGFFERADGGTLMLDELGELPLPVQSKLLRVLQDGVVERLGGTATRRVNVRVLAANNVDLSSAVCCATVSVSRRFSAARPPMRSMSCTNAQSDISVMSPSTMTLMPASSGCAASQARKAVVRSASCSMITIFATVSTHAACRCAAATSVAPMPLKKLTMLMRW
jgi:DNA-binding NtrC family response regulator